MDWARVLRRLVYLKGDVSEAVNEDLHLQRPALTILIRRQIVMYSDTNLKLNPTDQILSTSQWWEKVFGPFTVVIIENSQNTVFFFLVKILFTDLICKMYLEGLFIIKLSHSQL